MFTKPCLIQTSSFFSFSLLRLLFRCQFEMLWCVIDYLRMEKKTMNIHAWMQITNQARNEFVTPYITTNDAVSEFEFKSRSEVAATTSFWCHFLKYYRLSSLDCRVHFHIRSNISQSWTVLSIIWDNFFTDRKYCHQFYRTGGEKLFSVMKNIVWRSYLWCRTRVIQVFAKSVECFMSCPMLLHPPGYPAGYISHPALEGSRFVTCITYCSPLHLLVLR